MKSTVLAILLFALSATTYADCLTGEGKLIEDNMYFPPIHSVEVNVPLNLVITQGDNESVMVKSQEDILQNLNFIFDDGYFTISSRDDICPDNLTVYITISKLEKLELNSKTNLTATNKFTIEELELEVNEKSTVHISLDADEVSLDVDDGSIVTLSGNTNELYIHVDGSGKANTSSLSANIVEAELDGSGEITVNPTESLQAQLNGSGNIYYKNKPGKLEIEKDGTGSIIKMR